MLAITSGLTEGQVLQRLGPQGANATLTLSTNETAPLLATLATTRGRPLKAWANRRVGAARPGVCTLSLKHLPAGGPYRLTLSAGKSRATLKSFFVGDLWLLGGQSNMEGYGIRKDGKGAKPHPLIRAFSMRREWRLAQDPLHLCGESPDPCHSLGMQWTREQSENSRRENPRGVGPALFFANRMRELSGVPQGLICAAHGGTSMEQWDPKLKSRGGESLYASMLLSAKATGQPVAGVLWYQGESDAGSAVHAAYTDRMKALVAATRSDLKQPALPWIVVQIGRVFGSWTEPPSAWNSIQEQERNLPNHIRHLDIVAAIDVPLDDPIHVSSAGHLILADRMAEVAERLVYRKGRGVPTPQPARVRAASDGASQTLVVECTGVVGGLRAAGEPHGFVLLGPDGNVLPNIFKTTLRGDDAVLHLCQWALGGTTVCYGRGFTPVCNITDGRGHALPAFGPIAIGLDAAWLPFVISWKVSPVISAPARPLAALDARDLESPDAEVRTYGADGIVDEHPRWERRAGHGYFSSEIELSEPMRLEVLMGYDGPFRLWIDDQPFFTDLNGINPCIPDESSKRIRLAAGLHTLRVAMDTNNGCAWGFFLRFKRLDVTRSQIASGHYARPVYRL